MTNDKLPVIKRPPGRPLLYNNCMDMAAEIEMYFDQCMEGQERERYDKKRQEVVTVIERIPPTIAGLCRHLGFEDRHALSEYEQREEEREKGLSGSARSGFSAVIKRARSRIEEIVSTGMLSNDLSTVGSIFYLKNHCGYKDQQEQTHNTGIQVVINGQAFSSVESGVKSQAIDAAYTPVMLTVSVPSAADCVSADVVNDGE